MMALYYLGQHLLRSSFVEVRTARPREDDAPQSPRWRKQRPTASLPSRALRMLRVWAFGFPILDF